MMQATVELRGFSYTVIKGQHGTGALVSSKTTPGGWHVVRNGQCDCTGYGYRGICSHVHAVKALQQDMATPHAETPASVAA